MKSYLLRLAAAGLVTALLSTPAAAEPTAEDKVAAEALFLQGKKLVEEKKYAEAIPKFEASQRRDPGIGTLLHLADCYEQTGKIASAWATFREAAAAARRANQADRAKVGQKRADLLVDKLFHVRMEIAIIPGVSIVRNGAPVDADIARESVPLDPGVYSVEVKAPGKKPQTVSFTVPEKGGDATIQIPPLEDDPNAGQEPKPVDPPKPVDLAVSEPVNPPPGKPPGTSDSVGSEGGLGGQQIAGIVVGVVGLAALGVGTAFGVVALNQNSEADEHCSDTGCRDEEGVTLSEDAVTSGNVSTAMLVAGGVVVATGIVVFLTAPSKSSKSAPAAARAMLLHPNVAVGPEGGFVSVGGSF